MNEEDLETIKNLFTNSEEILDERVALQRRTFGRFDINILFY